MELGAGCTIRSCTQVVVSEAAGCDRRIKKEVRQIGMGDSFCASHGRSCDPVAEYVFEKTHVMEMAGAMMSRRHRQVA